MLDLNFLCENAALVEQNCRNRGAAADIPRIVALRQRRGELIAAGDALRHESKSVAADIPKTKDPVQRQQLVERGRSLKAEIAESEKLVRDVEDELRAAMLLVPNMTHPDAPVGGTEADNKVVRTWGAVPEFDFTPLDHVALAEKHDLIDLEGGARVTGHGFYFLKNEAVLLELALMQYAAETVRKSGFILHTTPDLARDDVLAGTGYMPRGNETQIYSIHNTDLSLVATAEITLGGMLRDQILDPAKLPLKVAGISHCFRTEAGGHGKATRGIYRVHQFTKVEMFAFTLGDTAASDAVHQEIVAVEERLFQGLGIPYRVVDICTGDLGGPAYRKFDLEAWMPGRGAWGEVTSASNCTDFQARRLGIRYKNPETKGTQFVHTLNGTAIAVTRALIAILENYQQRDGSIVVPPVLRPWVGCERIG